VKVRGRLSDWQETATVAEVMTTAEVAKAGGVSRGRVLQLIHEGRLDAVKRDREWLVYEASVLRWLRTRRGPGRPRKDARPERGEQLELPE